MKIYQESKANYWVVVAYLCEIYGPYADTILLSYNINAVKLL